MFKHSLATLLVSLMMLVPTFSRAEPLIVPEQLIVLPQAVAAVQEKCAQGCIIMDQADWAALRAQVQALVESAKIKKNSI